MELHPSPFTHCFLWSTDPGHPPRIWILDIFELVRGDVQNMYVFTFDFWNISSQFFRLCMWWAFCRRAANPWSDLHPGDIKKSIGEWLPFTSDRKRRRTKGPWHVGSKLADIQKWKIANVNALHQGVQRVNWGLKDTNQFKSRRPFLAQLNS